MKKHWMFAVLLGLLLCMGGIARAQGADVFVGYSFEQDSFQNGVGLHGYNLAGTYNLNPKVGIEANLAGHHGNTTIFETKTSAGTSSTTDKNDIFTFVFGPKLTHVIGPSNNFEAYTHLLVGGSKVHSSQVFKSGTVVSPGFSIGGRGFAFATGGGVDWFHGTWGIRILEMDLVRTTSITSTSSCGTNCTQKSKVGSATDFRIASGLIWRFGRS